MILAGKFRSKSIKCVSGISVAGQEDEWSAGSSPIKNFKTDTLLDGDELNHWGVRNASAQATAKTLRAVQSREKAGFSFCALDRPGAKFAANARF